MLKQPGGRKKPFYVKFKPDGEKRQRTLPGSSSASAWEAACKYGYYLATKAELPETEARNPRRSSEVSSVTVWRCVFCTCSRALTRLLCCMHRKCRRRRRPSAWRRPRSSPPSGRQRCRGTRDARRTTCDHRCAHGWASCRICCPDAHPGANAESYSRRS